MFLGVLVFTGQLDINYKNKVEYVVVISTIMFLWTFIYDFKHFKMDIDKIPKNPSQQLNTDLSNQSAPYFNQPIIHFTNEQLQYSTTY